METTQAKTPGRRNLYLAGGLVVAIVLLLVGRSCAPSGATQQVGQSAPAGEPKVLSGPTTTAPPVSTTSRPAIDPLAGLGSPVNSTALALVGTDYAARLELARRFAETMQRYSATGCQVFIGADAIGIWELSTQQGAAHPVPVLAACPWPAAPKP